MKWSDITSFEPGPRAPRDPEEPIDRFVAMDEEAEQVPDAPIAKPVVPCEEKPYLELALADLDGNEPFAGAPYEVVIGGAVVATGTLDGDGYARADGVDAPDDSILIVTLEERDEQPAYRIEVAPPRTEPELAEEDDADEEADAPVPARSERGDHRPDPAPPFADYSCEPTDAPSEDNEPPSPEPDDED
jgi:hypothetical protein